MSVYETIKMSPLLGLQGSGGGLAYLAGLAGGDKTYVDDLFSTALYRGNASSNTVPSGLDFTEGSWLSWIKLRDGNDSHFLSDSTQKTGVCFDSFASDRTYGKQTGETTGINAVGTSSYSIQGSNAQVNGNTKDYTSWNFKAAPGFIDIITWTGTDGSATRVLNHSLGSAPGMVLCKSTSNSGTQWYIYHKSLGLDKYLNFNTSSASSSTGVWNSVTSTTFGLGTAANLNAAGREHVAYLFADDDAQFGTDGDESIIKCGTYTGTNTGGLQTVNVGFEPQFVLIKNTTTSADWQIIDAMRGASDNGEDQALLAANLANNEPSRGSRLFVTNEGFGWRDQTGTDVSGGGNIFIYMAIRRPHKPPTAATEVFNVILSDSPRTAVQRPEKVDMYWFTKTGGFSDNLQVADRVRGFQSTSTNSDNAYTTPTLFTNNNNQERSSGNAIVQQHWSGGPFVTGVSSGNNFLNYMFKRAPGFMDIVAYSGTVTGNSDSQTVTHNLGVTPELMFVKRRSGGADWHVYSNALTSPLTKKLELNESDGESDSSNDWGTSSSPTAPNANNFTVGYSTATGWVTAGDFVAYLFATLPGISKVGSYTGNDTARTIDCGFTNGARFVLIKKTSSTGSWLLFDTARGINAGNDPFLEMNYANAEYTSLDVIDSNNSGFNLTSSSAANGSGSKYIFLAIA